MRSMVYKRRRTINNIADYMRRNAQSTQLTRSLNAARTLRRIGAPAMVHTFARPGERIVILQAPGGGTLTTNATSGGGMTFAGAAAAGDIINTNTHFFSQKFQLNYVTNETELTNLYDNYRIKAVNLKIDLSFNSTPIVDIPNNVRANALPMLHYCIDQDDNDLPTSIEGILEFTKSRSVRLGDQSVLSALIPRAQGAVATTTTTTVVGSMLPANTWLDCKTAVAVPHYGIKYALENMPASLSNANNQYSWALYITPVYILEMKNVN